MPEKIMQLVVDDGSVSVPVLNKRGEQIGEFAFRPTDIGIIDRYNEVVKSFDKVTEPLENISIENDGTVDPENEADLAAMREATKRLYDAVDYLFGGNMAEAFFGKMHPFSPVNGEFYCAQAINVVGTFIGQQFEAETAKVEKRVQKYTHGYEARTGKHKDGRA